MTEPLPPRQYAVSISMVIYDPVSNSRQTPGGISIGFDTEPEAWDFIRKVRDMQMGPSETETT